MSVNVVDSSSWLRNASNQDLRNLAYKKAASDTNDKGSKAVTNALYLSVPVAAGIRDAVEVKTVLSNGATILPDKATRLFAGLRGFAGFASALVIVDLVSKLNGKLAKHSETVRELEGKHPLLTTIGLIGTSIAAMTGLDKAVEFIGKRLPAKMSRSIGSGLFKFADKMNNSKLLNKVGDVLGRINPPDVIKHAGKAALSFAPLVLLIAGVTNSIRHNSNKNAAATQNYADLKTAQAMIS